MVKKRLCLSVLSLVLVISGCGTENRPGQAGLLCSVSGLHGCLLIKDFGYWFAGAV